MLSTLELAPDVLAYRVQGGLDRADIESVFAELDRKLASADRIRVYGEVLSLSGMSPAALWQEVRLGLQHAGSISRVERAALVTDLQWLRGAAVWQDQLFRGLSIRTFSLAEQAEARAWVLS